MKLKNKQPKKPKGFLTVMYETYKDFAENTSIHGLKYTVKSDIGIGEKIFWALVLFAGLISAIYMTFLFWQRYVSNPTRTTIKSYYAPTTVVTFPAVTLCNINLIMESKITTFLDKLDVNETEKPAITDALAQLLSFTDPNAIVYNEAEQNLLQDILNKNNYDISSVMQELAQNCSDMLRFCSWNGVVSDCSKLFTESLTVNGYCCSFNYGHLVHKELYTVYNGINSGILVLLDPMPQEVQYSSLHFSGFKVIIHDPTEYPGSQSTTKMVSIGKIAYLYLYGSKLICSNAVQMLPYSQRHCVYPEEFQLDTFSVYSDSNCLTECDALYLYKTCKCVPYYYKFIGKPICNATQVSCLLNIRKADVDSNACNCPSQCEDDYYNVFSAQTSLDFNRSHSMMSFGNGAIEKSNQSVLLNVFFGEQIQSIYLRDTIFSTVYLLSSFGGVYSLFMGCSLITVIEVIYYIAVRFIVNLKIFEKAAIDSEISTKPKKRNQTVYFQKWDNYTRNLNSTFLP